MRKMKIGTASASKGEIAKGYLKLGLRRDSTELRIPLTLIVGKSKGPTVWIQGAIHGDEKCGPAAIVKLLQKVSPAKLAGTLVCVPVVNTLAYETDTRRAFIDDRDMNRMFPGNSSGSYSERVAAALVSSIFKNANYVLDLHVGSHRECTYQVLYRDLGMEASRKARSLAEDMGAPVIWASQEKKLTNSILHIATKKEIPSLILEFGGGRMSRYLSEVKEALLNALQALNMIEGETKVPQDRLYVNNWHRVYCTKGGGILEPFRQPGDIVKKGDKLGTIISLHGKITETLKSPSGPSFIRRMAKSYAPLTIGEQAFALLHVIEKRSLT